MKTFFVSGKVCLWLWCAVVTPHSVWAEEGDPLSVAAQPMAEGVPEVAVARLREVVEKSLPDPEWRTVALQLAEALIVTGQPDQALALLTQPRLARAAAADFWRAQALNSLQRWNEALPLYQSVARDASSPYRATPRS